MRQLSASSLLVACLLGIAGCDSVEVPLQPLGPAGVSGSVLLREAFCKSPCVKAVFTLPNEGVGLRGEVRQGSCASPGEPLGGYLIVDHGYSESVSMVSDLDALRGSHCVQVHASATVDAGVTEAPVACGDIP